MEDYKHKIVGTNDEIKATIADALYSTNRFLTETCDELSEGIFQALKDADLIKKANND